MATETRKDEWTGSIRNVLIDYLAPDIALFPCRIALLFGSRHAQDHLAWAAAQLFRANMFNHIILAGGHTQGRAESEAAEIMPKIIACGVPRSRLILEELSMNTGENIANARQLVGSQTTEIFLIGKIYAKRRYGMTVKAQWPEIRRMTCFDINYFLVPKSRWWQHPELKKRIFSEARKISDYIEKGYIQEVVVRDGEFIL